MPSAGPMPSRSISLMKGLTRSVQGQIGLIMLGAITAVIILGPFVAPYPYAELGIAPPLQAPSGRHLLGTDQLGRDVLSRLLVGGSTIVLVPTVAVFSAFALGGGLGMYAAYAGGKIDGWVARSFDLALAIPPLLLALVIIAGLGTSIPVLVFTVVVVYSPRIGRVIRGATQGVVTNDYVAAAEARGESTTSIIVREILPNVIGPASAELALRLTYSVLFVSTLSFLGLGQQPPSSDWGLMVAQSRGFILLNPWATIAPAVAIAVLSIGFNFVADALAAQVGGASKNEGASF